jgi:hypothetical protein
MSTVLRAFDDAYKRIYAEEEEKATPREFTVERPCTACSDETYADASLSPYLQPLDAEDQCSICFETEGGLVALHACRHVFHPACIRRWYHTRRPEAEDAPQEKNNSCPVCRRGIVQCAGCNGTRVSRVCFTGVVPPYDADEEVENERPETDGPYGVYALYYEDLFFKGLLYDQRHNVLQLLPFEDVDSETTSNEVAIIVQ